VDHRLREVDRELADERTPLVLRKRPALHERIDRGPSLLGAVTPGFSGWLLPTDPNQFHLVDALGQVGVILLVGLTLVFLVALLVGAWPVLGFFGLDVLLVYWAFRANYRAASRYEQVTMTPSELKVRKVSRRGQVAEWTLNPVWVQLDREVHEEFGIERLFLVSHGRRLPIAGRQCRHDGRRRDAVPFDGGVLRGVCTLRRHGESRDGKHHGDCEPNHSRHPSWCVCELHDPSLPLNAQGVRRRAGRYGVGFDATTVAARQSAGCWPPVPARCFMLDAAAGVADNSR